MRVQRSGTCTTFHAYIERPKYEDFRSLRPLSWALLNRSGCWHMFMCSLRQALMTVLIILGAPKATEDIGACAASGCIVQRCVVDGPVDVDSAPIYVTD